MTPPGSPGPEPAAEKAVSHASRLVERHRSELRAIAHTLPERFTEAAAALERRLGEAGLRKWARIGLDLARSSPGSREVAVAFFEASPAVGPLDVAALSRWAEIAAELAARAPQAATAFVEATPAVLVHLELEELEAWAGQGRRLCRSSWKSAKLATRFFRVAPALLESLPLHALDALVDVVARLAERSDELASACLRDAPSLLARLAESDRGPFLAFGRALCRTSWLDVSRCFEIGPDLLRPLGPEQRSRLLELAAAAADRAGPDGFVLFVSACEALAALDPTEQAAVLESARQLSPHGPRAAIESVASAPEVRRRLGSSQARRWFEAGLELLTGDQGAARAESYFRIESALAEEMLAELAPRAELGSVGGVLRLYAKALTGEQILLESTASLVGRRTGWAAEMAATTDGHAIFLPSEIGLLGERDENFQVYKVHTTHQAGRLEFGSFGYRFGLDGAHLPSSAQDRERRRLEADAGARSPAVVPMQRFFDLFHDRRLIAELFALVEDTRIDACVSREYPGVRRWLRRVQEIEAGRRPDARRMPLRQAFVENLLRASLGRQVEIRWPSGLAPRFERCVATLRLVERSDATVQDAAEAAALLYDTAIEIPNLSPQPTPTAWSEDEEVRYESPDTAAYRGDFKPELVQLIEKLADPEGSEPDGMPLTREQILELLENSVEIEFEEDGDPELGDLETLLDRIEHEARDRGHAAEEDRDVEADDEETLWFRYDEWDFRADDYRPGWCRVGERTIAQGESDFYAATLHRYHGLVVETRRQFERMRPEWLRRLKRLEDGHEIDLDQAIEFHADKKAGAGPLGRFYARRNKIQRDVAVAFLLDMSGSTNEEISRPLAGSARAEKRIIDIERESTVLVVEALEAIGDAYGIFGFSGQGRENVEFYVIKDLDEPFDERVRLRIDGIEPKESTRMGPAIRHAVTKLNDHDAKVKILILVSDGRPQDEDYGHVRREKEYAVHDTKQALVEARRQRITPFLITVDAAGRDYLRQICDDMGYEVVADIESLPRRLPRLYAHLAAG
jgi:nitric oxide reductase activation protein